MKTYVCVCVCVHVKFKLIAYQLSIKLALFYLGLLKREMGIPYKTSESHNEPENMTKIKKHLSPSLTVLYPKVLSMVKRIPYPKIVPLS